MVGIVPADRERSCKFRIKLLIISNKHFGSMFAQNFLKLTEPLTFKSDIQVIDYWTIHRDFINHVNEHGLYVILLPITEGEYKELSNISLCCGNGHTGYLKMNTKCRVSSCQLYPTSQFTKLYLTRTVDYSL